MLRNKGKHIKQIFSLMMFLLILMPLMLSITNCKSPAGPDPVFRYRSKAKVVYERDPNKIIFPEGNDAATDIRFTPYDPSKAGISPTQNIDMEKVAENKFVGYIENVFIQQGAYQRKHQIYIQDAKLYDGVSDVSTHAGQNIEIEGAYEVEMSEHICYFKMAEGGSSNNTFSIFIQEK